MSTYWGYRCPTCDVTTDTWFNHGERILRSVAHCYPLIMQLYSLDTSHYLEVHIMGHQWVDSELWPFLHDHREHGIELYNEDGHTEPLEESEAKHA